MLLSVPAVAAQSNQLDKGPGLIGPGSPIYGLEVAMDNAALGLGLAKAGGLAKERAAEAVQAAERNNSKAAARAGEQLGKVAEKASENESEDIETAMASFQETMNKMEQRIEGAPNNQARQGMQTALENMKNAYRNMQEAQQKRHNFRNETGRPETSRNRTEDAPPKPGFDPIYNKSKNRREDRNKTENSSEEVTYDPIWNESQNSTPPSPR